MADLDDLLNQLEQTSGAAGPSTAPAPVSASVTVSASTTAAPAPSSSSSKSGKSSSSSKSSSGHSKSSSSSHKKDGSSSKSPREGTSGPVVIQAQATVAVQAVPTPQPVKVQTVTIQQSSAKPLVVQPIQAQTMVVQPGEDINSLLKTGVDRNYNGLLNEGATMMQDFGFKLLKETFVDEDTDGNTATDFKVSGNTSTIVGSPSILLLKGFNDQGIPTALVNPEKYVNVYYTHFTGVAIQPWFRENEDTTLAIGFYPTLVGDHNMRITLCGNELFETIIHVNPAGEEQRWVTRLEMPQVNKKWIIDIVRTDGSKPEGKYAFEVESQGNVTNLNIEDLGGQYRVTCVPITPGPVKMHIRLQGQYINGSPIELVVPGAIPQQTIMMPAMGMGYGQPAYGQQMMMPMNGQPQVMQPMNMQPQQVQVMKPMNAQPMNPQSVQPMNAQPMNAQPIVVQPVNAKPVNAQPVKATPISAQPVKATPVSAQPVKATPVQAQPIKATPVNAKAGSKDKGASDALADLLADLEADS